MYFQEQNLVIIPTRKCGGISVEKSLKRYFKDQRHIDLYNRGTMSNDEKHGYWRDRAHDVYVMVRNPFDKMVSNYFFSKRGSLIWGHQVSFEEFIVESFIGERDMSTMWTMHVRTPSVDFITYKGKVIPHSTIRLESLQEDFDELKKKYGFKATLKHANQSRKDTGQYRNYYTPYSKGLVESYFHKDLEYFDYNY